MHERTETKLCWRGLGLKLVGAAVGGVGLVAVGLGYSRIGGT